jgi:hypothetical protein
MPALWLKITSMPAGGLRSAFEYLFLEAARPLSAKSRQWRMSASRLMAVILAAPSTHQ